MQEETNSGDAEERQLRTSRMWAVGLVVGSLVAFSLVGVARALRGCIIDSASVCAKYVWLSLLRSDVLPVLATVSTTALLAAFLSALRSPLRRVRSPRVLAFGVLAAIPLMLIVGTIVAFGAAVLASWLGCGFAPGEFVGSVVPAPDDVVLSLSRGILGGVLVGIGSALFLLPRRSSELLPSRAMVKRAAALGIGAGFLEIVLSSLGLRLWFMP